MIDEKRLDECELALLNKTEPFTMDQSEGQELIRLARLGLWFQHREGGLLEILGCPGKCDDCRRIAKEALAALPKDSND